VLLAAGMGIVTLLCSRVALKGYGNSLRLGLTQRLLHPTKLNLDDPHTAALVEQFLTSDDQSLLEIGIASSDTHPVLLNHLVRISSGDHGVVAGEALQRLYELAPQQCLDIASSTAKNFGDPVAQARHVVAAGIISAQIANGQTTNAQTTLRNRGSNHLDVARAAIHILSTPRTVLEHATLLRKCLPQPTAPLSVRDLAHDDDRQWRRPWLSVCAANYLEVVNA
jgi:hypothetical protein